MRSPSPMADEVEDEGEGVDEEETQPTTELDEDEARQGSPDWEVEGDVEMDD